MLVKLTPDARKQKAVKRLRQKIEAGDKDADKYQIKLLMPYKPAVTELSERADGDYTGVYVCETDIGKIESDDQIVGLTRRGAYYNSDPVSVMTGYCDNATQVMKLYNSIIANIKEMPESRDSRWQGNHAVVLTRVTRLSDIGPEPYIGDSVFVHMHGRDGKLKNTAALPEQKRQRYNVLTELYRFDILRVA